MVEIAETFADSEKYLKAAKSFRLPYWDYYLPRSYKTVFPGVTMGQDKTTGEFLNLEDVTIKDRVTGEPIKAADVKVETAKVDRNHEVKLLASTSYPFDFGIPQVFMLEKLMMRLPPHGNVKLDHNPLRTFWFPTNYEIPESHWKFMQMNVSQGGTLLLHSSVVSSSNRELARRFL